MSLSTWEFVIVVASVILEITLTALLLRRRIASTYPSFFLYLFLNLIEDPSSIAIRRISLDVYTQYYFVITVLDYLLQLLILGEIARNVFRLFDRKRPFSLRPIAVILSFVLLAAIVVTGALQHFAPGGLNAASITVLEQALVRISLILAVLKILLFLSLAGFAQVLGISWKDHVLQLASGFAFFAAVSVYIQYANSHVTHGVAYLKHVAVLNDIQAGAYLLTLAFWIWAFSRNDAPRKEFTPQMQEVLVTIAQSAKRTRLAVTRSTERR